MRRNSGERKAESGKPATRAGSAVRTVDCFVTCESSQKTGPHSRPCELLPCAHGTPPRFPGLLVLVFLLWTTIATAAPQAPPSVIVLDRPNDAGTGLIIEWELSPDDVADRQPRAVSEYYVFREVDGEREQEPLAKVAAGNTTFVDANTQTDRNYLYSVVAVAPDGSASPEASAAGAMSPVLQWFDGSRMWVAIILITVCGAVMICTELAKHGMSTYVRPIAGLSAIDEAVGRATEMGRPMLFVPGIMDLDQIETIAGLTVMAHVGEKAAEYDTPMDVPTTRTLVMTAAKEALAGAYLTAGRPESFNEDRVYYVTEDQFGYVASVCGWMSREKPAACFYLGKFYAESLLLAETGNAVGAIQMAGTAEPAQLPFFVAACDYTLIGEELFAASAYLSGEPQQLGTLKGQDIGKLLAASLLIIGCLLATAAQTSAGPWKSAHNYLMTTILGKEG